MGSVRRERFLGPAASVGFPVEMGYCDRGPGSATVANGARRCVDEDGRFRADGGKQPERVVVRRQLMGDVGSGVARSETNRRHVEVAEARHSHEC